MDYSPFGSAAWSVTQRKRTSPSTGGRGSLDREGAPVETGMTGDRKGVVWFTALFFPHDEERAASQGRSRVLMARRSSIAR